MAEEFRSGEHDPELHRRNRAAGRLADAYLDFVDRQQELDDSPFGTRRATERQKKALAAYQGLADAAEEYRRLRVTTLGLGSAHYPEDWPA